MESERHDEAFRLHSAALSIHPANTQGSYILRSKVCISERLWEDALAHANEVSAPLYHASPSY